MGDVQMAANKVQVVRKPKQLDLTSFDWRLVVDQFRRLESTQMIEVVSIRPKASILWGSHRSRAAARNSDQSPRVCRLLTGICSIGNPRCSARPPSPRRPSTPV